MKLDFSRPTKAYCPLLIDPDFALPGGENGFIPFEAYKGGCFLFHIGEEYVVMDTLGREIKRVRAQSASLEQTDNPPLVRISLRYTCDGAENTAAVHTFRVPAGPPEPKTLHDLGYTFFSRPALTMCNIGLKSPKGKKIIPGNYTNFFGRIDQDGKGFIIAVGEKGYTYFDQDGERLIPFVRKADGSTQVHCRILKSASVFDDGLAIAEIHSMFDEKKIIMDTTGHCIGDRTWYDIGPVCGNLIPVREHQHTNWTLINRAGDILLKYAYPEVLPTPNATAFCVSRYTSKALIVPKEEVNAFCMIPSSTDDVMNLHWQGIQEAEPGLLWAWRDGRHELIDCRKSRTDFLSLYDQPIAKTRNVCWEKHEEQEGRYVLTAPGGHIRMTQDEFRKYINYLEKDCGLRRNFFAGPVKQEDKQADEYLLGFEGSRLHAPINVHNGVEQKTCSLIVHYSKTEDGFDIRLTAAGKPCPSIPPMPKNTNKRVYLNEDTYQACRKYIGNSWTYPDFCDPLKAAPPKSEPYRPDPDDNWDCRI